MMPKNDIGDLLQSLNQGKTEDNPTAKQKGKSADPEYAKICVYLPKALVKKMRLELLERDDGSDLSDLTAEAVTKLLGD